MPKGLCFSTLKTPTCVLACFLFSSLEARMVVGEWSTGLNPDDATAICDLELKSVKEPKSAHAN